MKNTVNQEPVHGALQRLPQCLGLRNGCVHGDDHIPKHAGQDVRGTPRAHGKGQDIGRALSLEVPMIELGDPFVVSEEEAQFTLMKVQVCEESLQLPLYLLAS